MPKNIMSQLPLRTFQIQGTYNTARLCPTLPKYLTRFMFQQILCNMGQKFISKALQFGEIVPLADVI